MNLQQLRAVNATVRHGFKLREAAAALYYSQNNIRKHIKDFETELGLQVFHRQGKTISGLTAAGRDLIEVVERILGNVQKLQGICHQSTQRDEGRLRIGATPAEARHVLPHFIRIFKKRFPGIRLHLFVGSLAEIKDLLVDAEVDLGVGTEFVDESPELDVFPWFEWPQVLAVPKAHPLVRMEKVTLEALAAFPLVTYHQGCQRRRLIDLAFMEADLAAHIVLSAGDDDVIKTYVELGLGVGILAPLVFDLSHDQELRLLDASHIFGKTATRICVRRDQILQKNVHQFIEVLAPQLTDPEPNCWTPSAKSGRGIPTHIPFG